MNFVQKLWRAARAATLLGQVQTLLGRGQAEAAWPRLVSLEALCTWLSAEHQFRVEVDMLSGLAALRLGDWNLSFFHARRAVASLRHASSRVPPPTRDYLLYYCRVLIEHVSWQLGGHPYDAATLTGVTFADVTPDGVPRDVILRFPIEPPAAAGVS